MDADYMLPGVLFCLAVSALIVLRMVQFVSQYYMLIIPSLLLAIIVHQLWRGGTNRSAKPQLKKFIDLYIDSEATWPPAELKINVADIQAFRRILRKQHRVWISERRLTRLVQLNIDKRLRKHFEKSFERVNGDLPPKPSLKQWAKAYVNTFQNDLSYVKLLTQMARKRGSLFLTPEKLTRKVENEVKKRGIAHRIRQISSSMASNKRLNVASVNEIDKMSGIDFEHFLKHLFSAMGYKATITRPIGDQGADLVLEKFNEKTAVQAKRYTGLVSNKAIQEVVASKSMYKCKNAIVVTNSFFTTSAKSLARANNVELVDRKMLGELIASYL